MLAGETLHVRRGRVDEMVDEADALCQAQHAIGQAIAELARDAQHVAQLDQRLEQPHDGRPRQPGFGGQLQDRAVRPPAQRLEDGEAATDGLDDGSAMPHHSPYCGLLRLSKRRGPGLRLASADDQRRQIPALLGAAAISKTALPSGQVSVGTGHHRRAVSGRRHHRHQRAHLCRAPVGAVGPAGGDRQQGGGNGIPAAELVARAKPDGLTLFATSAMTQAVNPALYDKLPYDPVEDFAPITRMSTSPFVLLVDKVRSRPRPSSRPS